MDSPSFPLPRRGGTRDSRREAGLGKGGSEQRPRVSIGAGIAQGPEVCNPRPSHFQAVELTDNLPPEVPAAPEAEKSKRSS